MGTICAPSYANIFIDQFERKNIYPLTEGKSSTYFIYIDGIFLIWTGTKNELDQFFKDLNKASKNCITFLDTEIYLNNGKLRTKIYRKETDQQHSLT